MEGRIEGRWEAGLLEWDRFECRLRAGLERSE